MNAAVQELAAADKKGHKRPFGDSREPATREDWIKAAGPLTTIITSYIKNPAVGTLTLGAFIVLKGYVLSKGDIPVALGILQNAGLPTIVVGGLLSGLPILVAAMLAGTIFNWVTQRSDVKKSVKGLPISPQAIAVLAAGALSLIFTQWPIMVMAAVTGFVVGRINRMDRSYVTDVAYLAALLLAVYGVTVMLYTVWLPPQKLTVAGVKPSPVGYVLADDPGGWTTILLSQQHGIVYYRDPLVTGRYTCEQAPYNFWSDIADAATPWQEVTKWGPLSFLHQAAENPC